MGERGNIWNDGKPQKQHLNFTKFYKREWNQSNNGYCPLTTQIVKIKFLKIK